MGDCWGTHSKLFLFPHQTVRGLSKTGFCRTLFFHTRKDPENDMFCIYAAFRDSAHGGKLGTVKSIRWKWRNIRFQKDTLSSGPTVYMGNHGNMS